MLPPASTAGDSSAGSRRVLDLLAELPLATAGDLAGLSGLSSSAVYQRLSRCREQGQAESVALGWAAPSAQRWFLTEPGLALLERLGTTWHEEPARCRLLDRLPSVEWFYPAAAGLRDLGPLEGFHWYDNCSIDAVARYRDGWIALFWSGCYQSEEAIARRLSRVGPDLRQRSLSTAAPWPGLLFFVVGDPWQRELVRRAARRYYLEDQVALLCAQDGRRSGALHCRPSRGWVSQPLPSRRVSGWSWEQRLARSPWVESGGGLSGQILETLAQWPGMTLNLARQSLGEAAAGRRVQRSALDLLRRGWLDRRRHRGQYRYMVTARGVDAIARRDRVHFAHCKDRVDSLSWVGQARLRQHEDGVMSFLGQCQAAGLPAAAGWRSWEHLGGSGGIAPDGLVRLSHSSFGATWAYLEYERSARTGGRIRRKLNGYASDRRGDAWPALVVCRDDPAEALFHQVGRSLEVLLLTTTIHRLARYGPLDNDECWRRYDAPARIG